MPRLFWKVFLALWLSMMGFTILMTWVQTSLVEQRLPERPEESFLRNMQRVERALNHRLREGGPQAVRETMQSWPRQVLRHVYVVDPQGREVLGRERALERVRRAGTSDRASDTGNYRMARIRDRDGQPWQLVILERLPAGRWLERGPRGMVYRFLLAGLVSALVSLFLARSLARPLVGLGKATRRLAAGEMETRVGAPLTGRKDEFGMLARDFDDMADRLQRLSRANRGLLRDVSHELRSPLARLRVALELARNRGAEAVTGELDRIELESNRLEALVGEVLDLLRESSETAPLRREQFDLAELLEDLGEVIRYEAEASGAAFRLLATSPLVIAADRELLWRALENLLRNALVHSNALGEVILEARQNDGSTEISVKDNGPGVPPQHLERIFDPFYRVQEARDRDSGGHGLGLAIAAAAIRRHGGSIEARNRAGGGLEIRVVIPSPA